MAVNQTKKWPGVVMEAITVALNHRSSGEGEGFVSKFSEPGFETSHRQFIMCQMCRKEEIKNKGSGRFTFQKAFRQALNKMLLRNCLSYRP